MNLEVLQAYCLAKKGVTEELPFDEDTLVFKVMGKMFALTSISAERLQVSLKCNPDRSVALRDEYDFVLPAWHMNKKHWNTVDFSRCSDAFAKELIEHSYALVVAGLTKKQRLELDALSED